MGNYEMAKYAYMIPVMDSQVPRDKPDEKAYCIYKIPVDGVDAFQKRFTQAGVEWAVLYSLHDSTGLEMFNNKT